MGDCVPSAPRQGITMNMHGFLRQATFSPGILLALQLSASLSAAVAGELWVTSNGTDSPVCGTRTNPCRSISQAILNANAGDTIEVGAGRYGDVNGDGNVDVGDEDTANSNCKVCIRKPLRIYSIHGAAVTLIDISSTNAPDTTSQPQPHPVVSILSSSVYFGSKDHGFTLTGGTIGLSVTDPSGGKTPLGNVRIAGNVAHNNTFEGFEISGARDLRFTHNEASGSTWGLTIASGGSPGQVLVRGNVVHDNRGGVQYFGSPGIAFVQNIVKENNQAMFVSGTGISMNNNSIINNKREGVIIMPDSVVTSFTGNTMVGNRGPGVIPLWGVTMQKFHQNNLYNNGSTPVPFASEPLNCGLENASRQFIDASNNFWGSPSGPGPDPADDVQGCNILGSTTQVQPVATAAFGITGEPELSALP